ncbi:MAG: inositol monophosphatase family protein [Candidatus Omnitrophota bacterium]
MLKTDYLDVAIRSVKEAGKIHKKYFQRDLKIRTKSSSFDLLTVADTESEKAIVKVINKYFPCHNILGEEYKYAKTKSDYTWIIDPLDGTNNFVSGLPIFCASVALKHNDQIIVGAIYDETRDELFYAQKNKGAFLNGKRIRVNLARNLKESLLITGFYYSRGWNMLHTLQIIKRFFFSHIRGLRRLGAAALDLCYVACGRVSGFWEFELSPWDYAAGKLLVEEAGGRITDKSGNKLPLTKKTFVVASNSKIHSRMLTIINK